MNGGGFFDSFAFVLGLGFMMRLGLVAFLLQKLVGSFEPTNQRNTWGSAFLASGLVAAIGFGVDFAGSCGVVATILVQAVPLVAIYRLSFGLSVALIVITGVASFAIGLAVWVLLQVSPLLAILGTLAACGLPAFAIYRERELQSRLDAVR
jgi:hypothetical protein